MARARKMRKSAPGAGQLFHAVGAVAFYRDERTHEPHILTVQRNSAMQGRWPSRIMFGWSGVKKTIHPKMSILERDEHALEREGLEEFSWEKSRGEWEPLIDLRDPRVTVTPVVSVLPIAEGVVESGVFREMMKPRVEWSEALLQSIYQGRRRVNKVARAVGRSRYAMVRDPDDHSLPEGVDLSSPEVKALVNRAMAKREGRQYRLTLHLVELTPEYAKELKEKLQELKDQKRQLGNKELFNAQFQRLRVIVDRNQATPKIFQPHHAAIIPYLRKMIDAHSR